MARITKEVKEGTKELILEIASKMFEEKGYEQTKTKQIAKECGIAEGTLFNYFESKDEILVAVFDRYALIDNESNPIRATIKESLYEIVFKPIQKILFISKSILMDLMVASIRVARKKPKLFHQLAAMDYRYIEYLEQKLSLFCCEQEDITFRELAEMIYGLVATEFILYLYESDKTYIQFEERAKRKIDVILKTCMKENNDAN